MKKHLSYNQRKARKEAKQIALITVGFVAFFAVFGPVLFFVGGVIAGV